MKTRPLSGPVVEACGAPTPEAVRAELERILSSSYFASAQRGQQFLRYIIDHSLNSPNGALKEYAIAVDVFERDASYDPNIDATVRVEASRLRSRLHEYYAGPGRNDPVVIDVPKGGYRATFSQQTIGEPPDAHGQPSPALKWRWVLAAIALVLLISAGTLLFVRFVDRQSPERTATQQNLRAVPLTTLPGREVLSTFSPDGSQVAFAWDRGDSNGTTPLNLYVKVIGSEKVDQLTYEPGSIIVPAWSPDGSTIAFDREGGKKPGIFSVPARGGPERKLADAVFDFPDMTLSWSPDGKRLLYYSADDSLHVLTLETGEVRLVDKRAGCGVGAAYSPDGKWIAFLCESGEGLYIDLLPTAGGPSKDLAKADFGGLAWSVDSQRIIFPPRQSQLSEINVNGKGLRDLPFAQENAGQPAIAPHGDRLAFTKWTGRDEIWRLDTRTGQARSVIVPATVDQDCPDISPDGKRVVFRSERSGSSEVWAANLDGSDAVQLSNFGDRWTGSPRWSPDGQRIVFDSRVSGKAALYLVDPASAHPRQIPINNMPASVPSWSPDGKSIYFTSGSTEPQAFLYRVPPEGGTPERITQTRGIRVEQSKDGRFLYFFAGLMTNAEIHVIDLLSGHEQAVPGMPAVLATDWALGSKGIYFLHRGSNPAIDFFDFSLKRVTRKIPLDKQPGDWGVLALSPDETWLAYSQVSQSGSDLMLVEGFR